MPKRILIVDDEPSIRKVLAAHLGRFGYDVRTCADGGEAIVKLQRSVFHLVVTDLKMPGLSGMDLLKYMVDKQPGIPVIMITAHGTVDSAVEAIKQGAFDYITKPFDQEELQAIISKALASEAKNAAQVSELKSGDDVMVGTTDAMRDIYRLITKVAPSPTTVLVTGESGTGKELVARALHAKSKRADGPFIQINCGAIPINLFEAELFGYEKGAFTGAVTAKPGRFELATGGTLFLDEIGELPRDMQVKILRAVQERKIDKVGGLAPIDIDVRVIAATNVDLLKAVGRGAFREDLYYRLNVIPINLPPLRERTGDIPLLVEHFLKKYNDRLGRNISGITEEALSLLFNNPWRGNIRELENLMERSILLAEGDVIDAAQLFGLDADEDSPPHQEGAVLEVGLKEYVKAETAKIERTQIGRALSEEDGNVTKTAKRLGISRKSLQTKMKEYGLRGGK